MAATEVSWLAGFDRGAFEVINRTFASGFFDAIMPLMSDLSVWMIPFGIAWILFMIRGHRRARLVGVCCFLVIGATDQMASSVIKPYVGRIRPCNVVPEVHFYQDGKWITTDKFALTTYKSSFSFPSSHAANIAGQAMYWGYFYPQVSPFLALIAAMVGYSRIYLGHHWPSDVLAGYLLGVFLALIIAYPLRLWVLPDE